MHTGMTKRNLPVPIPKAPVPLLEPVPGMFVTMFLAAAFGWQNEIGTGWRNFIVVKVGRKWITIFYPPLLKSIDLEFLEWDRLRPRVYLPSAEGLRQLQTRIVASVEQFERHGMRHRGSCTTLALKEVDRALGRVA